MKIFEVFEYAKNMTSISVLRQINDARINIV